MRHLMSILVFLVICFPVVDAQAGPLQGPGNIHSSPPPRYATDRILVKLKPGTVAAQLQALPQGDHFLRTIPGLGVHVLQVPAGTVLDRVAVYQRNPNVLYAEPDYNRILIEPNEGTDPLPPDGTGNDHFSDQWALNNTGQLHAIPDPVLGIVEVSGSSDADIDAPQAWDISTGSSSVKIGILDTGIDCRDAGNPSGSLEFTAGKCIEQVNFVGGEEDLLDYLGHGTHVAGIAAATTNNGIGIAGVGWNSSVGSLKTCYQYYYYPYPELGDIYYEIIGVCPVSASVEAIQYAADHDYHVINMSYASDEFDVNGDPVSYGGYSQAEADAVANAWDAGVVLVAAAGNEGTNTQIYPAAYPQVIAVGATDHDDNVPDFSSFGSNWVSLMAPGENIISTVPNEFCVFYAWLLGLEFDPDSDVCLDWYSGTSMASPHVAGAAAVVWGHLFAGSLADPGSCTDADGATPCNQVVRDRLESGADTSGALGQNMQAWSMHGRLNVAGALQAGGGEPPVPPPPPPEPEPEVPLAPAALSVGMVDDGGGDESVQMSWSHSLENVTDFDIERNSVHPKNNKITATTVMQSVDGGLSLTYTDLADSGLYRYRVRARNGSALSDWSGYSGDIAVSDSTGGSGGGGPGGGKGGKPAK
jgi:subtilisin family serine protease